MKRWLIILLLTAATAAAQASSENGVSTSRSVAQMRDTVILSASSDIPVQMSIPLVGAIASPGSSQLSGSESAPGKIKLRHTEYSLSLHWGAAIQKSGRLHICRLGIDYASAAFTRAADYYIYSLRRIII